MRRWTIGRWHSTDMLPFEDLSFQTNEGGPHRGWLKHYALKLFRALRQPFIAVIALTLLTGGSTPPLSVLTTGPNGIFFPGQVKPVGIPKINWSSGLAQGLEFYAFDAGQGVIVDLVSGATASSQGTGKSLSSGLFGAGLKYNDNSATAGSFFASSARIRAVSTPFTWAAGFVQTASPTGAYDSICGRSANDNSNPFENWSFQLNEGGSGKVRAGWSASSSAEGNSASSSNSTVTGAYTSELASFTSSTNVDFYENAVRQNQTTTTWATVNSGDNINLGFSGGGTTQSVPGFVYYCAFWSRALTASEVLVIHTDPYSFLLPQDDVMQTVFMPAAGAAFSGFLGLIGVGK